MAASDEKKNEMRNIAYISKDDKVDSSYSNDRIVLTYYHGANKYWLYVERKPFSDGHFKRAYKGTVYKSEITKNKSGTPQISDNTSVVLKIKHRKNASSVSKVYPIFKRSEWDTDMKELARLAEYTKEWNNGKYSDKTYEASKAFILKVSDLGINKSGQFKKDEYVMVEAYMPHFEKWNWPNTIESFAKQYSVQAFAHFTYHISNGKEIVVDAQGYRDDNKYIITDPYYVDGKDPRCHQFFMSHKCNKFCDASWIRPKKSFESDEKEENIKYGSYGDVYEEMAKSYETRMAKTKDLKYIKPSNYMSFEILDKNKGLMALKLNENYNKYSKLNEYQQKEIRQSIAQEIDKMYGIQGTQVIEIENGSWWCKIWWGIRTVASFITFTNWD